MGEQIRTKSVYEPSSPDDGLRVLTTQYWPRGVRKERVGKYLRVLGPSRILLHGFKEGDISWNQYRRRYLTEMQRPEAQTALSQLRELSSADQAITIMCVCRSGEHCHRTLIKQLLEDSAAQ